MAKKIVLIATGGTISTGKNANHAYVSKLSGEELVSGLSLDDYVVETINFRRINSTYMTPQDMLELGNLLLSVQKRDDVSGIVVTHGTSTLEETVFFLDLLLPRSKPIVFTGSQRPATVDWPDGPSNLASAFRLASDSGAQGRGILVVFADKIYLAREVYKSHTAAPQAFAGGETGFVYPDKIIFSSPANNEFTLEWPINPLPPVDIVPFYSGAEGHFLKTALDLGVAGLIVEGLGAGNVNEAFYHGIKEAREAGIQVVITSRCQYGSVFPYYGYLGGGKSLQQMGVIFGGRLSSAKARLFLMLTLANAMTNTEIQDFIGTFE